MRGAAVASKAHDVVGNGQACQSGDGSQRPRSHGAAIAFLFAQAGRGRKDMLEGRGGKPT